MVWSLPFPLPRRRRAQEIRVRALIVKGGRGSGEPLLSRTPIRTQGRGRQCGGRRSARKLRRRREIGVVECCEDARFALRSQRGPWRVNHGGGTVQTTSERRVQAGRVAVDSGEPQPRPRLPLLCPVQPRERHATPKSACQRRRRVSASLSCSSSPPSRSRCSERQDQSCCSARTPPVSRSQGQPHCGARPARVASLSGHGRSSCERRGEPRLSQCSTASSPSHTLRYCSQTPPPPPQSSHAARPSPPGTRSSARSSRS